MFNSADETKRIMAEQMLMRPGQASDRNLCQYKDLCCIRCCLPHIGEDSHKDAGGCYLGPGGIRMKFTNYNSMQDPRIEASQYEDSFPDAGKEEMERRFSGRRRLFLEIFDSQQPRKSLSHYMEAVQAIEGYRFKHAASAGPLSQFCAASVAKENIRKGELPECQLLGFVDEGKRVGCMAHPGAAISQGYDGRDQVGFFHHTGCCGNVGCEASKEFPFLSRSAIKIFEKASDGMSWYAFSRHATSVLVYYLRSYDCLLLKLDEQNLLDALTLEQLVEFTNSLYEAWPLRGVGSGNESCRMDRTSILSAGIPLTESIMYIALDSSFLRDEFAVQLIQARTHIQKHIESFTRDSNCR